MKLETIHIYWISDKWYGSAEVATELGKVTVKMTGNLADEIMSFAEPLITPIAVRAFEEALGNSGWRSAARQSPDSPEAA